MYCLMKAFRHLCGATGMMTALFSIPAIGYSSIVSYSSTVDIIAPPSSVTVSALESDNLVRVFREQVLDVPGGSVNVDMTLSGTVSQGSDLTPGSVALDGGVASYFIHYDTVSGTPTSAVTTTGSITFNTPVLGLMLLNNTLDANDTVFGLPTTMYPTGVVPRGIEGVGINGATAARGVDDIITLSADRRTVSFSFGTGASVDQMRVLTAVPLPASLPLFISGIVTGVVTIRRRKVLKSHKRARPA